MPKFLIVGADEFATIRTLVASIEMDMIPESDTLNFKPNKHDILLNLSRIRQATKRFEALLEKEFPSV